LSGEQRSGASQDWSVGYWSGLAFHGHSICTNPIIQLHAQIHKFSKVLWFFSLIYQACLKFLGKTMFEGGLLHIGIIAQDSHEALELSIVVAEILASLSELIEVHRCTSTLIRVPKSSVENTNEFFNILKVNPIGKDIMLNLVLDIAFQETVYIVDLVLLMNVA
jgi:hypothetical protein